MFHVLQVALMFHVLLEWRQCTVPAPRESAGPLSFILVRCGGLAYWYCGAARWRLRPGAWGGDR